MEIGPIFRTMAQNKIGVGLLVVEIAITLAIVLNCINLIGDQMRDLKRPNGLDEQNIIAVTMRPYAKCFEEREYRRQVIAEDLAALRAMPGVVDASAVSTFPLIGGGSSTMIKPLGAPDQNAVRGPVYSADDHFVNTLGLELVEGRLFREADLRAPTQKGPRPTNVIVTRDLADALFPDGNALGQQLDTGMPDYPDTIVGILKHMYTPYGGGPMETRILFFPNVPGGSSRNGYLVRTEPGAQSRTLAELESKLLSLNSERIVQLQTLLEVKGAAFAMNQILAKILGAVIVLLIFVTGLGLLGMTSFAVSRRTKQIGVRRALGACRTDIIRYFLLENGLIISMGIALGLLGAFLLNVQLMAHVDSSPLRFSLVLSGMLILWGVGFLATLLPALRGASIAPAIASRTV